MEQEMASSPVISRPTFLPPATEPSTRKVILQVGEQRFTTTRETLRESTFLATLLSNHWNSTQEDGSYFIDADPALFAPILQYLRRGIYPVFYDRVRGHDYARYAALLQEARFLGIRDLQTWLQERKYLDVVRVEMVLKELVDLKPRQAAGDTECEFYPAWVEKVVYKVPDVTLAQGINHEQVRVLDGMVVEKRVVFDMEKCVRAPRTGP